MINVKEKILLEDTEISKKYIESSYRFLYALDDIVIKSLDVFSEVFERPFQVDFFITYDGFLDIVYIWFDKDYELLSEYIGMQIKGIQKAINNYFDEEKFISIDVINDKLVLELNYRNERVIQNNKNYNLKYLEI